MSKLPLEEIRVTDFTLVIQGPYATLLLAQMGAEVIKVESTRVGEGERDAFSRLNFSKKSVTLNLKDSRGLEVAKNLIKVSDIVVENFATGVMDRLGLSYEELKKVKPDIIMVSATGLGSSGPLKNAVSYFAEVQNFAGVSNLAGYKDGKRGTVMSMWGDYITGMLLSFAAQTALRHRNKTGEGQHIQVAMAENLIASIPEVVMDYTVNGRDAEAQENEAAPLAPHNVYRSQGFDKWIAIAVTNEEEWDSFCQATGHSDWAADERFADPLSRWHNHEELDKLVTQWTLERTNYEAMQILQAAGVPAGPNLDGAGLANDPHLKERGVYVPIGKQEDGSRYMHVGHPWNTTGIPQPSYELAPLVGENNEWVLKELLGMSGAEIAVLGEAGVLS
jgi:benzylsuccinate CoA-transferase BbsF subunit